MPGSVRAPRTQSTARAEKGLAQGGRPKPGQRKSQGCGCWPMDCRRRTDPCCLESAPLSSSQSAGLPSQAGAGLHSLAWPQAGACAPLCGARVRVGPGAAGAGPWGSNIISTRLSFLIWKIKMLEMMLRFSCSSEYYGSSINICLCTPFPTPFSGF